MSERKINICHLYPDLLNLYGDTGNIICLKSRIERRSIECSVTGLSVGEKLDPSAYDMFFIGGGQDFEQDVLIGDAETNKKAGIKEAMEDGKVFLAICGGYQILGDYYETWDGNKMQFMGCIDYYTKGHPDRMIGNYMFTCDALGGEKIVGFENHSGKTYLGSGVESIGDVLKGYGNNGEDGREGMHYKNVFGAYCHGPMLPKNPKFCDLLIATALERKYGTADLAPLDDTLENNAHEYMVKRLSE